jgi:VIT1/CCC1 family predicted Fe2+/Mn2+ transporter
VLHRVTERLRDCGLAGDKAAALEGLLRSDPASLRSVATALESREPSDGEGPLAQSLWMLVADFFAAAIPIIPFALWPVPQGRIVSATVTLVLLIGLGVGRAWVGGRNVLRTVAETVAIGVAAAMAGVTIGVAIAHAFGA